MSIILISKSWQSLSAGFCECIQNRCLNVSLLKLHNYFILLLHSTNLSSSPPLQSLLPSQSLGRSINSFCAHSNIPFPISDETYHLQSLNKLHCIYVVIHLPQVMRDCPLPGVSNPIIPSSFPLLQNVTPSHMLVLLKHRSAEGCWSRVSTRQARLSERLTSSSPAHGSRLRIASASLVLLTVYNLVKLNIVSNIAIKNAGSWLRVFISGQHRAPSLAELSRAGTWVD